MMHGTSTGPRPIPLNGDLRNLPEALEPLMRLPNWVVWKYEWRVDKNGGGKWTKPPYQPNHPQSKASTNNPKTWGSYQAALSTFEAGECDGIGFCLFGTDLGSFDLDNCIDPATGAVVPEAMAYVDAACSYTEISVSGTGMHVIGYGMGAKIQRKQKIPGTSAEIESYRKCERYIVVTGNPLPGSLEAWPHLINIDAVIDGTVAELDGAEANGPGGASSTTTGGSGDLDKWIEANSGRYEHDDDDRDVDDRRLDPKLKAILANTPPAPDMSKAFHHAVCWLHFDLQWSARKIENYIASAPVVPERYENRLHREICRCLCNADKEKAQAKAAKEAKQSNGANTGNSANGTNNANTAGNANQPPQGNGIPLDFYEDFDKAIAKRPIIKGVIYKGERSSWVGPPGSGKSGLLASVAISAAAGISWRGYRSKEKVAVVYFALERKDLVKRMRAYAKPKILFEMVDGVFSAASPDPVYAKLPIAVAGKSIDLLDASCVAIFVDTVRAAEAHYGIPVGLIIIDTVNKGIAMGGGDENMARDHNIAAANLQAVQDELTEIHVAMIGHTGKDESRGARGSNAHQGDVDLQVQISVNGGVRTATIIKVNDGMDGVLTRFRMEPVELGQDEDGDPITTAIVADEVPASALTTGLSRSQARAVDLLEAVLAEEGDLPPETMTDRCPEGARVVPVESWRERCVKGWLSPGGTEKGAQRAFQRAMKELLEMGRIGVGTSSCG